MTSSAYKLSKNVVEGGWGFSFTLQKDLTRLAVGPPFPSRTPRRKCEQWSIKCPDVCTEKKSGKRQTTLTNRRGSLVRKKGRKEKGGERERARKAPRETLRSAHMLRHTKEETFQEVARVDELRPHSLTTVFFSSSVCTDNR